MPLIPTLRKQRKMDLYDSQASWQFYTVSSRPLRVSTVRLCLQTTTTRNSPRAGEMAW